jgi:hypothetical protein
VAEDEVVAFALDGAAGTLGVSTWLEPLEAAQPADVLSATPAGSVLVRRRIGSGSVIAAGTHLGLAYQENRTNAFEDFLGALLRESGAQPDVRCSAGDGQAVQWRTGSSGADRLLFVTNHGPAAKVTFTAPVEVFAAKVAIDLLTDAEHQIRDEAPRRGFNIRLATGATAVLLLR